MRLFCLVHVTRLALGVPRTRRSTRRLSRLRARAPRKRCTCAGDRDTLKELAFDDDVDDDDESKAGPFKNIADLRYHFHSTEVQTCKVAQGGPCKRSPPSNKVTW